MALYSTNNRRLNSVLYTSKGNSYATGILTIFVFVAMIMFAIVPAFNSISTKTTNNKLKQDYINNLNAKKEAMDTLSEEYDTKTTAITTFENITLSRIDNELVVANLEQIAKECGATLISSDFSERSDLTMKDSLATYTQLAMEPFTFTFKGKVKDLAVLESTLEKFPIPLEFDSMTYSFGTDASKKAATKTNFGQDPDFTMTLTGVYYYWNNTVQ